MPQLTLIYARQLLSDESDIEGDEQIYSSAKVCVKVAKALEVQRYLDMWEVPEGYPLMQTFLPHILYYLNTYFVEEKPFKTDKNDPANKLCVKWLARMNMFKV